MWFISVLIFLSCYVAWFLSIWFLSGTDNPSIKLLIAILVVVASIVSPLLGLFLWKQVGGWVSKKLIFETLKTKHEKKGIYEKP
ncbi:MAG: hypothetical protein ACTSQ4_09535 [Candidatus Heimdallarchaeaceae archaeon]